MKPEICLYDLQGFGLIIKEESGVIYTNQAGGTLCLQPKEEGFLVPIEDSCNIIAELDIFFRDNSHLKNNLELIDRLNQILSKCPDKINWVSPTFFLEIDKDNFANSSEAWLHVNIISQEKHLDLILFKGFKSKKGILTWNNSD